MTNHLFHSLASLVRLLSFPDYFNSLNDNRMHFWHIMRTINLNNTTKKPGLLRQGSREEAPIQNFDACAPNEVLNFDLTSRGLATKHNGTSKGTERWVKAGRKEKEQGSKPQHIARANLCLYTT